MVLSICTNYSLLIHIIIWFFWAYINKHVLSSYITTTISSMSGLFKWIILSSYLKHNPFWAHIFKNRWQFVQHVRFEQSCISSSLFFCSLKVLKTARLSQSTFLQCFITVQYMSKLTPLAGRDQEKNFQIMYCIENTVKQWQNIICEKADLINCHQSQNGKLI